MKIRGMLHLMVGVSLCLYLNGCGGMSASQIRRAQLVGGENLQLKKQMKDKDAKIDAQIAQIADLTAQLEQAKKETEQGNEKLLQSQKDLAATEADYQKKLKECEETLRTRPVSCPDLEKKYDTIYENLLRMLNECQQKMEKYENAEQK